jgi:hypothetical protein
MDSLDRDRNKDKDRFKIRRPDETLARRLGEALDEMDERNASDCPDGEILASYAEQGLGQAETEKWESHFASCPRCRKILLVLTVSADTPLAAKEVAHLGERSSGGRSLAEISRGAEGFTRSRFADWRTRWLAPALGVAAVMAMWFAIRPHWRASDRGASGNLVALAHKEETPPSEAPAQVDKLSKPALQQDQITQPTSSPDRSTTNAPSLRSPSKAPAQRPAESGEADKKVSPSVGALAGSALQKEKNLGNGSQEREILVPTNVVPAPALPQAKAEPEAPLPAPLPPTRAQANMAAPSAPEAPRSTAQTVTVAGEAPVVQTNDGILGGPIPPQVSANLPLNGRKYQALATLHPASDYTVLLKAPSASTLWRGGKGGIIERSTNAGRAWAPQNSPSQDDWLAGAAVSDTVCWLAGRNGAIARTVDGNQWERIAPPAQAAAPAGKSPDWIGVVARDALNATIAAGDGRHFTTQDGGKTWQAR